MLHLVYYNFYNSTFSVVSNFTIRIKEIKNKLKFPFLMKTNCYSLCYSKSFSNPTVLYAY